MIAAGNGTAATNAAAGRTAAADAPFDRTAADDNISAAAPPADPEIDLPLDGDDNDPPAAAASPAATAAPAPTATPAPAPKRSPWADLGSGYEPDQRVEELITAYPTARPGPAGAIHGVGVTVLVTDLQRSVGFYRDALGFFVIDQGSGTAVLASGDTRLVLRKVDHLPAESGQRNHLNLEVGDVEAVYRELKGKGIPFGHGPRPVTRGDSLELWAASFHDPDGHDIDLTQWRAAR